MQEIDVMQISPWKLNPRSVINEESIAALAESIKSAGVLQPIVVRPANGDKPRMVNPEAEYIIVAGERRYRAACIAGLETVPAIIKDITQAEALEIAIIENLQREDISAIEEARAYKTYLEASGVTQTELAEKIGKSQAHIANRLRLLKLPEEVQGQIISGEITATEGRELATIAEMPEVVEEALTSRKSGWTMAKSIAVAKNQYDRKCQETEELEKLRMKFAKQIGDRVTELQNQGYTVYQGATKPDIDSFEYHYMWDSYKRCEGCNKAVMVVDVWHSSYAPARVDTKCYCPDKKCFAEAQKEYNNQRRHPLTAEEKRKKELRKTENDRRGEKLSLFLVQAAAVNAELEHPEARLIAEFIFFGFYNNDKRLEEVCKVMGWEIKGGVEATIHRHLTNDRPDIILKAAAILIAVRLEEQLKRSDEPIQNQYAGREMKCYFNWLAGRGYNVPTKLGSTDIDHCREFNKCEETCEEKCHI